MSSIYFEEKGPALLEKIGMSKAEFARQMGVQRQNVNALFKSKNVGTIRRASEVLHVPFELLIGYPEEQALPEKTGDMEEPGCSVAPGDMTTAELRSIEDRIRTIRNMQVILDADIAELYGVETKRLNEQVKRNKSRFPQDFMFQLSSDEDGYLKSQNATSSWGGRRTRPFAFTELGVAMLSSVLTSEVAIQANVKIMRAFAQMRRFLASNSHLFLRLDDLEYKIASTDLKVERLYGMLEARKLTAEQGIFYDGQIFDAYVFVSSLIRSAEREILLVDNYVNDEVLTMLDKRAPGVRATICTRQISSQLRLDLKRHNAQYPAVAVKEFGASHDRFLAIDDTVYHVGASLKDLGRKWFAFSRMEDLKPVDLLAKM